jgi:hypothetical protein
MPHRQLSAELEECIRLCLMCYRSCAETAAGHCLDMGGRHVEPQHFRLMLACAEVCRTTAALMLTHAPQHHLQCGVCAQFCALCAESCREVGDMEDCVAACEACAESCERMAASGGHKPQGMQDEPRLASPH